MKTQTFFFAATLTLAFFSSILFRGDGLFAQAPDYLWAKNAGGTTEDSGESCTADANGNVFVTGYFESSSITFGTTTLNNAGYADMYIVKYDANGNVLWAKSADGTSNDYGYSCSADANGNVFVSGSFYSSSITFGTTTLNNTGSYDMYIVKYDANGNVVWAKSADGTSTDEGFSCSADANGNVFVSGYFSNPSITFGTTTLNHASTSYADMYIVKYDANGNVLWAKSAGGTSNDYGQGCSADANGNVFVSGNFYSSAITFGTTTLNNAGSYDMYIVKYDANGNVAWAKSAGGASSDAGNDCTADANGNVFVSGYFNSPSITFGTTTLNNASGGSYDMYIVKYDANGNVVWAKSAGGTDGDNGNGCTADANGNVFVSGAFKSSSLTFGTTTLNNASTGYANMYIVKYDANGNVVWAKSTGGTDYGLSCSADANGNLFVTGYFESSSISFGTTTLNNTGYEDMYIVKLAGTTTGIVENEAGNNVFVFPNPTNGEFTIDIGNNWNNGIGEIEIYNALGEKIHSSQQDVAQTQLDLSNQPSGIYFLYIKTENGTASPKLILQK